MKAFFLLFIVSLSSALCPYGATYYAPDNVCYLTAKLPVQWTAGESICRNLGGHLANIKNEQQNDFVHLGVETLTTATFVGIYYSNGEWLYSDGTPATYTNFEKGAKPSNHSSQVALMLRQQGGKWQIAEDKKDMLHSFVCEIPVCSDNSPTPSTLDTTSNTTGLKYGSTSDSWYYGSIYTATTIEAAVSLCESAAGYLPTIRNAFENSQFVDIVQETLGNSAFYEIPLGYHSSTTGIWSWYDHTNTTYSNWAVARKPLCLKMRRTLLEPLIVVNAKTIIRPAIDEWYARNDILNRPYLCQFRVNSPTVCA